MTTGSALPTLPQSVPRGRSISWLHWFASATACQVACPPVRIRPERPAFGDFYFQAFDGSVSLPVAGYNYNSDWTPLLAGLPPAGMAASFAARSFSTDPSGVACRSMSASPRKRTWGPGRSESRVGAHDAAVLMIDTSIIRVISTVPALLGTEHGRWAGQEAG
jgi:hypothetical protein